MKYILESRRCLMNNRIRWGVWQVDR